MSYIYMTSGCFQSLQLVSNNIATWLLTTVPGSMEQHQPPPWFVPTMKFEALQFWHATILPFLQ